MPMNTDYMETPLGILRITAENGKIKEIHSMRKDEPRSETTCRDWIIEEAEKQLSEYFDGKRRNFELKLDFSSGSEFQQKIWKVLSEIPYGKTLSYGQVARLAGNPKGSRACGNAVGANPFLIVIPCHRVIKGDGSIGGFGAGIEKKKILFGIEGIELCKK